MASNKVNHVCENNSPLSVIVFATAKMPAGDPTRNAEIHPSRTPISHSAKNITTAKA